MCKLAKSSKLGNQKGFDTLQQWQFYTARAILFNVNRQITGGGLLGSIISWALPVKGKPPCYLQLFTGNVQRNFAIFSLLFQCNHCSPIAKYLLRQKPINSFISCEFFFFLYKFIIILNSIVVLTWIIRTFQNQLLFFLTSTNVFIFIPSD